MFGRIEAKEAVAGAIHFHGVAIDHNDGAEQGCCDSRSKLQAQHELVSSNKTLESNRTIQPGEFGGSMDLSTKEFHDD